MLFVKKDEDWMSWRAEYHIASAYKGHSLLLFPPLLL